jgi:hypothetical protein
MGCELFNRLGRCAGARGLRVRHASIALTLLAVVLAGAPAARAGGFRYGINTSDLTSPGLNALPAENITVARTGAPWSSVQPSPPPAPYDWSSTDLNVTELAEQGMTWLPIAMGTPAWAATATPSPQAWFPEAVAGDPSAYGRFVAALAQRYGPGGTFWQQNPQLPYLPVAAVEAWNEENNPNFFSPSDDPAVYYGMYEAARQDTHALLGDQVQVIFGGLLDSGLDPMPWLAQLSAQRPGAFATIDALAYHPYLYELATIVQHLQTMRVFLDERGATDVPIAITEIGDNSAFSPEQAWAGTVYRLANSLPDSGCGVNMFIVHEWKGDNPQTPDEDSQGWYTLATPPGALTRTGQAFASGASATPTPPAGGAWCAPLSPGLKLTIRRLRYGRMQATISLAASAKGVVTVTARRPGQRAVTLTSAASGAHLLPASPGRWTVTVTFDGSAPWADARATHTVTIPRRTVPVPPVHGVRHGQNSVTTPRASRPSRRGRST